MNKAYRVVFNKAIGVWMAVSEIARGRGKGRAAVKAVGATLVASAALFSAPGAMAQTADSLIHQEESTGPIYIGDNTLGTEVSFSNHDGDNRRLTGVANGQSLTDAANVGQVRNTARQIANALGGGATADLVGTGVAITAPTYRLGVDSTDLTTPTNPDGTQSYHNVGTALGNLNNRIKENGTGIAKLNANTVQYDIDPTTGGKTGAVTLNAGTTAPVALKNVADGAVVENSKDAVNGGQLFDVKNAAEKAVEATKYLSYNADAQADPASATGKDALAVGGTSNASGKASTALGAGAGAGGNGSVAVGNNSQAIGTEAIAVGQYASANFASSVAIGTNSSTDAENSVALGADSYADRASTVSVGSTGKERQITNVKAGTADTDAANYGQVKTVQADLDTAKTLAADNAKATSDALGGKSTVDADGKITAPTYSLATSTTDATKTDFHNVGDALDNLDTRTSTNTTNINNLSKQIGEGSIGLVQKDATTGNLTVDQKGSGTEMSFAGTDADGKSITRKLTNVTAGTADTDAANVGQLNAVKAVADNSVQYDAAGNSVTLKGAGTGPVQIKNVADGTDDTDAVNVKQLKAAGVVGDDGKLANVVVYDNADKSSVTFNKGGDATRLQNVANGVADSDAVNFSQLNGVGSALGGGAGFNNGVWTGPTYTFLNGDKSTDVGDALSKLDGRVFKLEGGSIGSGGNDKFAGSGNGDTTKKEEAQATGNYATASGANAVASGKSSTATGANAVASAENSVALGADSVADRANTVSVGSAGKERAITNVAEATQATDAVNKAQLDRVDAKVADVQNSIGSLQSQVSQVDTKVNRVGAMSAAMSTMVASAAGLQTDNRMAIGTGVYRGQAALAIGYQRKIGSRATVTIGGSTAGGSEYNVGIGAGYGW